MLPDDFPILYIWALRERGLADRTIFSRASTLITFLRSAGIDGLVTRRELPRYTEEFVDAHNQTEISRLFGPLSDFSSATAVGNRKLPT